MANVEASDDGVPVSLLQDVLDLSRLVSTDGERADQSADRRSGDPVDPDPVLLKRLKNADVRDPASAASG